MQNAKSHPTILIRWGKSLFECTFYSVLAYVIVIFVGHMPVNNDFPMR